MNMHKSTIPFRDTPEQQAKLEAAILEHKDQPGALMPVMQQAQEIYGYLPIEVQAMIAEKGERVGLAEAKKHLAWYCHGLDGAAAYRGRIMQAATLEEMERAVRELAASQDGRLRQLPPRDSRQGQDLP